MTVCWIICTCTCETAGNKVLIIKRTDFQTCILLLNRLVTPSILRPYCWLLKHFKENKETTNHAIIKMLHRVAVDLKTPAMLFQLSLFCTFQKILCDPAANQYKVRLPYACQSKTPKHSLSTLVGVHFFPCFVLKICGGAKYIAVWIKERTNQWFNEKGLVFLVRAVAPCCKLQIPWLVLPEKARGWGGGTSGVWKRKGEERPFSFLSRIMLLAHPFFQ